MKTLTRIYAVALLMMISMGARSQVRVDIDTFTGGTVSEKSQSDPGEDRSVRVTITVTPDDGYEIAKSDVMVAATLPTERVSTRSPQIAMMLGLEGDDPDDLTQPRDYTFTVDDGFGAWVHTANFHRQQTQQTIESGIYRISHASGNETWYLWPSVTTDADGHPYLTTFNDISAPALDYPSKGVAYDAFGEAYSLWQVTPVEADGTTYYQLFNMGLQQYVVWSDVQGEKAVHLEASPADVTKTWFRFDGDYPNGLITPSEAAAGTTLNSKAGDKPFLSSSGEANAAAGYPDGEPDADGNRGLMQIYVGTPVWTLEPTETFAPIQFEKTSDDGEEAAAPYVPPVDMALPTGVTAYFVTGVDLQAGVVLLQELDYLPQGMPVLLLADADASGFVIQPKGEDIPSLTDEEIDSNRLRIGSPTSQPKAYEDYIFFRGEFVMVSGGTLSTGKVFLDLSSEEAAATRSVLSFGDGNGTTAIESPHRQPSLHPGWYTLDGHRLNTRPTRKGLYIMAGKKVWIK